MVIAPWLTENNPLDLMRAGASLGLQLRQQNQSEANAADVLRLHQDQLMEQDRRAREALDERKGEAAARLGQASAQLALQAGHYKDAKQMQTAAQALTKSHYDAMESVAERRQKALEDAANIDTPSEQKAISILDENGKRIGYRAKGPRGVTYPIGGSADSSESLAGLIQGITAARGVIADKDATDDEKAKAAGSLPVYLDRQRKALKMGLVPNVTTNSPWYGGTYLSTNYVPGSAASALSTPPSALPVAPVSGPSSAVPTVNTKAEYDALPLGADYLDSHGKRARKK